LLEASIWPPDQPLNLEEAIHLGSATASYIIDWGTASDREAADYPNTASQAPFSSPALRQAQDAISEEAARHNFVNQRWLGGLLNELLHNSAQFARLRELEAMTTDGRYDTLSKKEIARLEKERRKLAKNLDGIRGMSRLPDAVFIVDTKHEQIAVDEARKLKIPVVGVVDKNCDPDEVDYVIPGNDHALRSIRLFAAGIAGAVCPVGTSPIRRQHRSLETARPSRKRRRPRPRSSQIQGTNPWRPVINQQAIVRTSWHRPAAPPFAVRTTVLH
jgi:ribosomal protein S2